MTPEGEKFVLDSYALLAYLGDEPGGAQVKTLLEQAQDGTCTLYLCIINLGEILYITERLRGLIKAQQVQALIEALPLVILEASRDLVLDVAHLKAGHSMSYADAFAAAVAQRENATVLTGDPEFAAVEELVRVEWLE